MIRDEKGIALVLSLFLMAAMSVVAASLMFLSQTETYSSMNYRLMSQARYGAESGIQKTANYLVYTYAAPGNTLNALEPTMANYVTTGSPVTYNGNPVVLASSSNCATVTSNYPVPAVQAAFCAAAYGTLPSGTTTVTYATTATLLSMQQVSSYGNPVLQTIQTWLITADGTISAGKTATVEVSATLETQKVPASMYAAFGTNPNCASLTFGGSSHTDSYDSSTPGFNPANPITASNGGLSSSGGNVGTNGNLGESGNATIDGTLSSPRVGVGACSAGNVDALSSSGNAKICPDPNSPCTGIQTGAVAQLPQAVTMPTPTVPDAQFTVNTTVNSSTACADFNVLPNTVICTKNGSGDFTINPNGASFVSFGNLSLTGGANLTLTGSTAGVTYDVNSITLAGNSTLNITGGTVILDVSGKDSAGTGLLATPIDLTGGSFTNQNNMDPSKFQIQYAGTGEVKVVGGDKAAALIMAPNAAATLAGNSAFYGSLTTSTLTVPGNADIHYDRHLSKMYFTTGNAMMSAFSWKKY